MRQLRTSLAAVASAVLLVSQAVAAFALRTSTNRGA